MPTSVIFDPNWNGVEFRGVFSNANNGWSPREYGVLTNGLYHTISESDELKGTKGLLDTDLVRVAIDQVWWTKPNNSGSYHPNNLKFWMIGWVDWHRYTTKPFSHFWTGTIPNQNQPPALFYPEISLRVDDEVRLKNATNTQRRMNDGGGFGSSRILTSYGIGILSDFPRNGDRVGIWNATIGSARLGSSIEPAYIDDRTNAAVRADRRHYSFNNPFTPLSWGGPANRFRGLKFQANAFITVRSPVYYNNRQVGLLHNGWWDGTRRARDKIVPHWRIQGLVTTITRPLSITNELRWKKYDRTNRREGLSVGGANIWLQQNAFRTYFDNGLAVTFFLYWSAVGQDSFRSALKSSFDNRNDSNANDARKVLRDITEYQRKVVLASCDSNIHIVYPANEQTDQRLSQVMVPESNDVSMNDFAIQVTFYSNVMSDDIPIEFIGNDGTTFSANIGPVVGGGTYSMLIRAKNNVLTCSGFGGMILKQAMPIRTASFSISSNPKMISVVVGGSGSKFSGRNGKEFASEFRWISANKISKDIHVLTFSILTDANSIEKISQYHTLRLS